MLRPQRGVPEGVQDLSGLTHLDPELRDRLPRSARALMAWQRLDNPAEGSPDREAAFGLLLAAMVGRRRWAEIAVMRVSYDTFLRESD